jgi:hypothetical protein
MRVKTGIGASGVTPEHAHQFAVDLNVSDRALGLGLEIPGGLNPDYVMVPPGRAPLQPVDLDPAKACTQSQ